MSRDKGKQEHAKFHNSEMERILGECSLKPGITLHSPTFRTAAHEETHVGILIGSPFGTLSHLLNRFTQDQSIPDEHRQIYGQAFTKVHSASFLVHEGCATYVARLAEKVGLDAVRPGESASLPRDLDFVSSLLPIAEQLDNDMERYTSFAITAQFLGIALCSLPVLKLYADWAALTAPRLRYLDYETPDDMLAEWANKDSLQHRRLRRHLRDFQEFAELDMREVALQLHRTSDPNSILQAQLERWHTRFFAPEFLINQRESLNYRMHDGQSLLLQWDEYLKNKGFSYLSQYVSLRWTRDYRVDKQVIPEIHVSWDENLHLIPHEATDRLVEMVINDSERFTACILDNESSQQWNIKFDTKVVTDDTTVLFARASELRFNPRPGIWKGTALVVLPGTSIINSIAMKLRTVFVPWFINHETYWLRSLNFKVFLPEGEAFETTPLNLSPLFVRHTKIEDLRTSWNIIRGEDCQAGHFIVEEFHILIVRISSTYMYCIGDHRMVSEFQSFRESNGLHADCTFANKAETDTICLRIIVGDILLARLPRFRISLSETAEEDSAREKPGTNK